MIKSVTLTNHRNESLMLDLYRPWDSGLAILRIDGLNPPNATINSTELSSMDGSVFNSSRVSTRNIVLELKILPHKTIEETRHMLYQYCPIKKPVTITIESDTRTVYTVGYVETNDIDIFSDMEKAQLSFLCPEPYFYSTTPSVTLLNTVSSVFEFPFSNPVGLNELILSEMSAGQATSIYYAGEAEVGLDIEIHATGNVDNLRLYNVTNDQEILIDTTKLAALTGHGIISGDVVNICTVRGRKSITLNRGGVVTNILGCLSRNTGWFTLEHGDNVFVYSATSGVNDVQITMTNNELYEGI